MKNKIEKDKDEPDDKNGLVVQLVECPTVYGRVAGSYPVESANKNKATFNFKALTKQEVEKSRSKAYNYVM